jgi:hypothetical protein
MSALTFFREAAGAAVYIAPPGTDPNDTANWQAIGTTAAPIVLTLDESEPLLPWGPFAPYTITITASRSGLTWFGYRTLFGRTHPHARRTKTEYHRRRR